MRLMDADALKDHLEDLRSYTILGEGSPYYDGETNALSVAIQNIDNAPTVDAVPVVRCRDCKYAHMTYGGEVKYCDRISMPDDEGDYGYALYLPGDWFCADGEKVSK